VSTRLTVLTMVDGVGLYGGAESMARAVAMRLDNERFESIFCVTRWEAKPEYEHLLEDLDAAGVEFLGIERHGRSLGPWRELIGFMRRRGVDVLHTHKLGSNFWGSILSAPAQIPVLIAEEHGVATERPHVRRILDPLIARRADAFVAVCGADRDRMIEVEGVPPGKIRVIHNGIVGDRRRSTPEAVRKELGISPDAKVVGAVATMRPEKAIDVLIQAAAPLARQFPDLRVLLVGGPDFVQPQVRAELEEFRDSLNLREVVTFVGLRLDIPDIVSAFDVAVLCSDREASPLSIMEYMEAGKPTVATRVGGIPELVQDGQTGLLVEPRDPDGLAEAVATLLDDPERSAAMGEAARELRRTEYDLGVTVKRFEQLYEELAGAQNGRP
jgi:glycosyltransferase involved in cell wall biosynthesis